MNWIKKVLHIGEKIKSVIKKRPSQSDLENSDWVACCAGAGPILKSELKNNLWCCPKCNKHHEINPTQRFDLFFGKNNYDIIDTPLPIDDPLDWPDEIYKEKLKTARKKTGQKCSVLVARGKIKDINITSFALNMNFIGGSINTQAGEAIITAVQHAIDNKNPLVSFSESGGQSMYESLLSLSQMPRTVLAINELKNNNLPYINCFVGKTYGGVTASWAGLSDIAIAEPGSEKGFAGKRVISSQIKSELPENFQTVERGLETGFVDYICERKDLKNTIETLLRVLLKKHSIQSSEKIDETSEDNKSITSIAS